MELSLSSTHQKAFAMGAVAGMRAMTAPAILSNHFIDSPSLGLAGSNFNYLQKSGVATGMKILAFAEMFGDKIPKVPNRIAPIELLPRVFSGALVGATIAEANGESRITGGLLGIVGAVASSYAFYYLRKKLGKATGLPDAALALAEDALAVKLGTTILR
ncbi:DUF4126 family protein [Rufibacter hautae]|uniref:DUF4126 family protein n=1 Tax=Rufibacter hautae TaxID=2595005 RepID=A0A5B6TG17_9BACT|nr:DUF4126 family protein [Rufibacter hautae]KAA3438245.1 DUF4126 family protein [Rufibacter hautae]